MPRVRAVATTTVVAAADVYGSRRCKSVLFHLREKCLLVLLFVSAKLEKGGRGSHSLVPSLTLQVATSAGAV